MWMKHWRGALGVSARRRAARLASMPIVACLLLGGSSASADAATFVVEPTQIFLSDRGASVLLTLRNESGDALRFELSVFAWGQSPTGEMQLEPTEDIVFFPSLLTIAPGQSRRVRVGATSTAETREKTYRIFIEELPPLDRQANGVRVLTKMGVPIFLRPAKEVATATLTEVGLRGSAIHFALTNTGTVHFVPSRIRVRGLADSTTLVDREVDSWYLLAGGRRDFDVGLPQADCNRVRSLLIDVQFGSEVLQERVQTPSGVCTR